MSLASSSKRVNPRLRELAVSATLAINRETIRIRESGRDVYPLGFGKSPFPVPEVLVSEMGRNAHQKEYLPVEGLLELRQSIASYRKQFSKIECSPEQIVVGPGSKQLIFILQFVHDGGVLLPAPSWVSYAPQAGILQKKTTWLDTDFERSWKISAEQLDKVCESRGTKGDLLILNYPGNPSGLTYSANQLQDIAEVARKHELIVLADEIYAELLYEGEHTSMARFYPEGTIISSAVSKWCGAGGWRLGSHTFPVELEEMQRSVIKVASEIHSAVSAPTQYATVAAFNGSKELDQYLANSKRILGYSGRVVAEKLQEVGVKVHVPQGGFYVFPEFSNFKEKLAARNITDGETFCHRLLEDTGIALLPGSAFGRPKEELSTRLAFIDFDGAKALEEAKSHPSDCSFLDKTCRHMFEGIDRLCEWLDQD